MGRAPNQIKKTQNPAVLVDVLWRDGVFFLVLENHSDALVRDVQVVFRRKIIGQGGKTNIATLPIWSKLPVMPPRRRIEVVVDRDAVFFARNTSGPVGVSVTYAEANGTRLRGQLAVDFGAYEEFPDLNIR